MTSFAEGVPVVLMEAMAAEVAVVATRIAGIPELVEDGISGFLVPPGDVAAVVNRVEELINDSALSQPPRAGRPQKGRAGIQYLGRGRASLALTSALAGECSPIRPAVDSQEPQPSPPAMSSIGSLRRLGVPESGDRMSRDVPVGRWATRPDTDGFFGTRELLPVLHR